MKIYLDLVFLINFCYDFLILMTIDITLKRHTKIRKMVLSALVGGLSLGLLFLPLPSSLLFLLKIAVSIIMVLIAFRFKDLKYTCNNLLYLYMISITLGGFLYFLNVQFSYKQEGIIFYFDGLSTNYILLIIIAPIILYLYIHEHKKIKSTYNLHYEIRILFKDDKELVCQGFLDSGNRLRDPITKKYVILLEHQALQEFIHNKDPIYVPYKA
ncbi:MAG: sigma-E processing peptidase SpoIIGA, partial [Bacilli bacterium]|nr:sigma-E processing peptidase SpoIIGA [Bacilli bacterium]